MTELVLRQAGPDDDEAIAACIAEAFPDNPKADVDVLRWQYRDNPFGETSSWVWDDGGRIVAHYSGFPMPCLIDGEVGLTANAVDAAVAPDQQGKGLFTPLARALYEDCAAKGMAISYCFGSNPVALHAVGKAGWMEVARLRTAVLPVDDGWVAGRFHVPRSVAYAARRILFRLGSGPAGQQADELPDGIDDLWARVVAAGDIRNGTIRGEAWFRWRYEASPRVGYKHFVARSNGRLDAIATVLVKDDFGGRFAYLLELLAVDADHARRVLRAVAAGSPGIAGLATLAVSGSQLHRIATSAGMRTLPRRLEPKPARFGFVDNAAGSGRGTLAHLRRATWQVGWGDLDQL